MRTVLFSALVAGLASLTPAAAQSSGPIKRTPLQSFDVPGTAFQTVIGTAEIAPGASIGRHTHAGPESGYVLEGELTLLIDGQPPKTLKPGDSYLVPGGTVHDARSGERSAKVVATYVVEKGKPFATPAP